MDLVDFTPGIDPELGDLVVDDGQIGAAESVAIGLVVWTLRTPLGTCLAAPDLGVNWALAAKDLPDAPQALERELERAMRWIVELELMTNRAVTVNRTATGRLRYQIAFDPAHGAGRRIVGTL